METEGQKSQIKILDKNLWKNIQPIIVQTIQQMNFQIYNLNQRYDTQQTQLQSLQIQLAEFEKNKNQQIPSKDLRESEEQSQMNFQMNYNKVQEQKEQEKSIDILQEVVLQKIKDFSKQVQSKVHLEQIKWKNQFEDFRQQVQNDVQEIQKNQQVFIKNLDEQDQKVQQCSRITKNAKRDLNQFNSLLQQDVEQKHSVVLQLLENQKQKCTQHGLSIKQIKKEKINEDVFNVLAKNVEKIKGHMIQFDQKSRIIQNNIQSKKNKSYSQEKLQNLQMEIRDKVSFQQIKQNLKRFQMIVDQYSSQFQKFDQKFQQCEYSFKLQIKELKNKLFLNKEKNKQNIDQLRVNISNHKKLQTEIDPELINQILKQNKNQINKRINMVYDHLNPIFVQIKEFMLKINSVVSTKCSDFDQEQIKKLFDIKSFIVEKRVQNQLDLNEQHTAEFQNTVKNFLNKLQSDFKNALAFKQQTIKNSNELRNKNYQELKNQIHLFMNESIAFRETTNKQLIDFEQKLKKYETKLNRQQQKKNKILNDIHQSIEQMQQNKNFMKIKSTQNIQLSQIQKFYSRN